MNKDKLELIDGFFNKGWACDLDEVYSAVIDTINDLQKKAELGETYKKLYGEIKKQKDDVVNRIKVLGKYDGKSCTRGFKLMTADFNDLLRMLGEIDVED